MTNAEKFKEVFGVYATETWAMPVSDFLQWLNGEYNGEERKTGKWITERIGVRSYATKCSACGTVLHEGHNFDNAQAYKEYIAGLAPYDKYCHCGAKMEVDNDN